MTKKEGISIARALELLEMLQVNLESDMDAEDLAALRLSEEALKRIKNQRVNPNWKPETLLPGETKD